MKDLTDAGKIIVFVIIIIIIIIIVIIIIIKWIVGMKCFVTVLFNITRFFSSESEFFE